MNTLKNYLIRQVIKVCEHDLEKKTAKGKKAILMDSNFRNINHQQNRPIHPRFAEHGQFKEFEHMKHLSQVPSCHLPQSPMVNQLMHDFINIDHWTGRITQ